MSLRVADDERSGRRLSFFIEYAQCYVNCRAAGKENIRLIAEADILSPLADVEAELRFAFARVAAVKLDDAVFKLKAGENRLEGRFFVEAQIEPAIQYLALADLLFRNRVETETLFRPVYFAARPHGQDARALSLQAGCDSGFVAHFDKESSPAVLDQFGSRLTLGHPDAAFGIDVNIEQTVFVEHILKPGDRPRRVHLVERFLQRLPVRRAERRTQIIHRLDQPSDLRGERLQLDFLNPGQLPRYRRREKNERNKQRRACSQSLWRYYRASSHQYFLLIKQSAITAT